MRGAWSVEDVSSSGCFFVFSLLSFFALARSVAHPIHIQRPCPGPGALFLLNAP